MMNLNKYILHEENMLKEITDAISGNFQVIKFAPVKRDLFYYDTFDWRLYHNSMLLLRESMHYNLTSLDERKNIASLPCHRKRHLKFWWEFPESMIKTKLKSIADIRALLPVVSLTKVITKIKINTSVRRNVALLSVEELRLKDSVDDEVVVRILVLSPVKNVLSEFLELQRILRGFDVVPADDIYTRCLNAAGKTAGDYASKIEISLDPGMPSVNAAKRILQLLFNVMEKNEEGIKKNIDIEFLHDYRVAVRRTRSVLGQVKGVFSPVVTAGLKNEFSKLGKLTNEARDLDVYLLRKSEYESMLPGNLSGYLNPLFKLIKSRGEREHKKLVRWLNSSSYSEFKKSYTQFLNENSPELMNVENSDVPIGKLATEAILNKYDQVTEYGNNITKNTPDEDLHRLRIECKKLRYLLELFSSIYPPKKVEALILQLKKLQTNLGDFNDMYVQQESLREYLDVIPPDDKESINTAAAIGGLITHLHCARKKVRKAFKKTFGLFYKSSSKKIKKSMNIS